MDSIVASKKWKVKPLNLAHPVAFVVQSIYELMVRVSLLCTSLLELVFKYYWLVITWQDAQDVMNYT